ncbi:MAG TPA: reverse transcriptase domain-containing protein, partial [Polyangiaceae bacterium]|nr:reverse transcriptase domain-containing protein [Polyangiaceae bacterium]
GSEYSEPDVGTVQGTSLSPLLGNVYLHHVLDLWFERDVRPRMRGKAHLVRYADDLVIGFEREDNAKRVMAVLGRRFERFGLRLHPDKTRLLPFARPRSGQTSGKGPTTFDFLGFSLYWARTRGDDGRRWSRRARRACDGPSRPSPTGAEAVGICRSSSNTLRSCDASMDTATTLA